MPFSVVLKVFVPSSYCIKPFSIQALRKEEQMELADVNLQEEQEELSNKELQLKMEEVDDAFAEFRKCCR